MALDYSKILILMDIRGTWIDKVWTPPSEDIFVWGFFQMVTHGAIFFLQVLPSGICQLQYSASLV